MQFESLLSPKLNYEHFTVLTIIHCVLKTEVVFVEQLIKFLVEKSLITFLVEKYLPEFSNYF